MSEEICLALYQLLYHVLFTGRINSLAITYQVTFYQTSTICGDVNLHEL